MATLIDALIVSLGLDGSEFQRGVKQTEQGLGKVSEAGTKTGKDMDQVAKHIVSGFLRVRNEVLGFFALLSAGRGVKELTSQITTSDAATGRLAASLGMSTEALASWQVAAERSGGTAEGMTASIQALSADLERFKLTGVMSDDEVNWFVRLHISPTDENGRVKQPAELLSEFAKKFPQLSPQDRNFAGSVFHMDQGTINTLAQGLDKVTQLRNEAMKLGLPTNADAKRAQNLINDVANLQQAFEDFGRTILNDVSPALDTMMRGLLGWIEANKGWLENDIGAGIRQFITWLEGIDWPAVWRGAKEFGQEVLADFKEARKEIVGLLHEVENWKPPAWLRSTLTMLGVPMDTAPAQQDRTDQDKALGGPSIRDWFHKEGMGWLGDQLFQDPRNQLSPLEEMNYRDMNRRPGGGYATDEHHLPLPKGDTATPNAGDAWYKPILDLIGKGEGTDKGRNYNETLAYGKWTDGPQNLTGMTLAQIDALQQSMLNRQKAAGVSEAERSSAVGRYQFTQTTLRDMEAKYGLDRNAVFDQAMQDHLARLRIEVQGDLSQNSLAKIWASFPLAGTGNSAYGQRTGVTSDDVQRALGGMAGSPPQVPTATNRYLASLAPSAAARWSNSVTNNHTTHDNSSETHIGNVNIVTQATDARGIARDMKEQLARQQFANQANFGLA